MPIRVLCRCGAVHEVPESDPTVRCQKCGLAIALPTTRFRAITFRPIQAALILLAVIVLILLSRWIGGPGRP